MLKRFINSPFSGYIAIALLIAAAGAGYWFWTELKQFGGLEEKAIAQEQTIQDQAEELAFMRGQEALKQEIGAWLSKQTGSIDRRYAEMNNQFREALKDAPKEYIDCRNMLVPERLRYDGPGDS